MKTRVFWPGMVPLLLSLVFADSVLAAELLPLPRGASVPEWPKPLAPKLPPNSARLRSQDLELVHSPDELGGFDVRIAGKDFAMGQNRPLIGYLDAGNLVWFNLSEAPEKQINVSSQNGILRCHWEGTDAGGGHWRLEQEFRTGSLPGAIDIRSEVTVDKDRQVVFLPMFVVFPGAGSFGKVKGQGLFAGLEYLENEPSSSEADVKGAAAKRQVPSTLKITFPLMAIQNENRFLALVWQMRPQFSAVFDSPDRLFGSGGHVMGLIFPGSDGKDRQEGELLPRSAGLLSAHASLILQATLLGGLGPSVAPAIEQYVRLRGLPPRPAAPTLQQYVSFASGGWLDSKIRQGNLIRHAIAEGNFSPGPAADAAVWMDWLAGQSQESALAARLHSTAAEVIAAVPAEDLYNSGVGHVRYPMAPLVYGHVRESLLQARALGRQTLGRFEPDGSLVYRPAAGGPDYARTHWTNQATGYASRAVEDVLLAAAFTGNPKLRAEGLQRLNAMSKFRNGVPRGAQTWECPLHTPDILASAQMVRAYTLGYELTGDSQYLEQARYWAWTGVPFVYLVNPTGAAVGTYSTIAVFGATHWDAPVWLGLPVQWCGLVYADALYGLARHDPKAPWKKLAEGITLSGIQQSWPGESGDLQGLLPDSFVLAQQHRNGPAINPATVQACASQLFNAGPYDFRFFPQAGVGLHVPGTIKDADLSKGRLRFSVESWVAGPYFVLINGLHQRPKLKIQGKATDCSAPNEFLEEDGQLILKLTGSTQVELSL